MSEELTHNSPVCLVCTKCKERVRLDNVVMDHDPTTWRDPMRATYEKWHAENGKPKPPDQAYHACHKYARFGGSMGQYLCGPLRAEDEGDHFIRWFDENQAPMNSGRFKR